MKNVEKPTPLPLITMAKRTEELQRISVECILERMKNDEWRETGPPTSRDNGGQNRDIIGSFSVISLRENEELRMEIN